MQEEVARFIAGGTRLFEESVTWGSGTLPLQITYYLGNKPPPLEYVSSVRAIVFQELLSNVVEIPSSHLFR